MIFFQNKPKVKCTHSSNHTEHYFINCHTQDTTALQPNVFLIRIHWLLVTNKRWSASFSSNYYQGQLINCHAQDTTALQTNVFLTGIHRLLVTNKRYSASFSSNYYQGQLQATRSLICRFFLKKHFCAETCGRCK